MNFESRNLQRLSQKALAPFIALVIITYFIYHSVQGDRGILAWVQLNKTLEVLQEQVSVIQSEREVLEERVRAMRPESINRDLLDQQVRLILGHSEPDEVVILKLDETAK